MITNSRQGLSRNKISNFSEMNSWKHFSGSAIFLVLTVFLFPEVLFKNPPKHGQKEPASFILIFEVNFCFARLFWKSPQKILRVGGIKSPKLEGWWKFRIFRALILAACYRDAVENPNLRVKSPSFRGATFRTSFPSSLQLSCTRLRVPPVALHVSRYTCRSWFPGFYSVLQV